MDLAALTSGVIKIAREAGEVILDIYRKKQAITIQVKADSSPQIEADIKAHKIILEGLNKLQPDWPVLSEEMAVPPYAERVTWPYYWLVDPLDGTKEFLHHNDEFTVNIALIQDNRPIMGVIYAPVFNTMYYASEANSAYKITADGKTKSINTKSYDKNKTLRIISSRRHNSQDLDKFLQHIDKYEIKGMGSSLKMCLVAEGEYDIYPRLTPTSEWDTAAAQCILEQAGGALADVRGIPLRYNTKDSLVNPGFFAVGDVNYNWFQYVD